MFHQDFSRNRSICLINFSYMYSAIQRNSFLRGRSGEVWLPKNLWRLGLCVLCYFFKKSTKFLPFLLQSCLNSNFTDIHATLPQTPLVLLVCNPLSVSIAEQILRECAFICCMTSPHVNGIAIELVIAQWEENVSLRRAFFCLVTDFH